MNPVYLAFFMAAFLAVALFFEGLLQIWRNHLSSSARIRRQRLRSMAQVESEVKYLSLLREQTLKSGSPLAEIALRLPQIHQVERLLQQTGIEITLGRFLGFTLLSMVIGLVMVIVLQVSLIMSPLFVIGFTLLPFLYVRRLTNKRIEQTHQQLPEALSLMSRSMRAGHTFSSALKFVGEEMGAPLGAEMRRAYDEINYGMPVGDALYAMAERIPSKDLRYFVVAVMIQRDTGGNLAEVLDNLKEIIRERIKLHGKVRTLSAEGRLSAWILGVLPFLVGGVMHFLNPDYIRVLFVEDTGIFLIKLSLGIMFTGVLIMRQIIRIKV